MDISNDELMLELGRAHAASSFQQKLMHTAALRIRRMKNVLEQLRDCKLSEENCADLSIATRRIRNLAYKGLSEVE